MHSRTLGFIVTLVVLAAFARLLPHPPNFVPMGAIALFAGATLGQRPLAYAAPLLAMLAADAILGLHAQLLTVYGSLALVVWLGTRLGVEPGAGRILGGTLAGATLFYLVTNLGVWAWDGLYPLTLEGLLLCYVAALPFFGNSLLADLLFAGLLFGGLALYRGEHARLGLGRP